MNIENEKLTVVGGNVVRGFINHKPSSLPTKNEGGTVWHDVKENLKGFFPNGHERFIDLSLREVQLHSDKNHDYSSGGAALGNFDRVAAILKQYPGLELGDRKVVALVYALKQLDAVLWGLAKGIKHKVEGLDGRLQDISVYVKLVQCMLGDEALEALAGADQGG